jgi:hypothetical protein
MQQVNKSQPSSKKGNRHEPIGKMTDEEIIKEAIVSLKEKNYAN